MMRTTKKTLEIATSPHIASGASVDVIMRNVVYALLPVCAFSIYVFGLSALVTLTAATLSCLLTEHLLCRWRGEASTIGDWSVAITGILLGLTLPPGLPVWMGASQESASASSCSVVSPITRSIRRLSVAPSWRRLSRCR
jgi:electron transport complex protein RnfD